MKKSTLLTPALAVMLFAFLTVGAVAEARETNFGGPGHKGHWYGPAQELTQDQQASAQKIYDEFYSTTGPLHRQIMSMRGELQAEIYKTAPDAKKIEDISREIGAAKGRLTIARLEHNKKFEAAGLPSPKGKGPGFGAGRHGGHRGSGMGQGPCGR